jgi:hypothetical protein
MNEPNISYYRLFYILVNLFIISIPLNSFYEVKAFLLGGLGTWSELHTPLWIKALKDLFLIFSIVLIIPFIKKLMVKQLLLVHLFLIVLLCWALFSSIENDFLLSLIGIRAYWAILFIYVGFIYNKFDVKYIFFSLTGVFFLHLVLQIIEMFYAPPLFQPPFYGLNLRNPGIFVVPATAGAFSLLVFALSEMNNRNILKKLAIVSIILSNSTMALLILIANYGYKLIKKVKQPQIIILPLLLVFIVVFFNLDILTGRGDGAYISMYTRLGYIWNAFSDINNFLLGKQFGIATSMAVIKGYPGAIVADNTFSQIYLNIGFLGLILLSSIILLSGFYLPFILYLIFIGHCITTVFFELNSIIQFIMFFLGVDLFKNRKNHVK